MLNHDVRQRIISRSSCPASRSVALLHTAMKLLGSRGSGMTRTVFNKRPCPVSARGWRSKNSLADRPRHQFDYFLWVIAALMVISSLPSPAEAALICDGQRAQESSADGNQKNLNGNSQANREAQQKPTEKRAQVSYEDGLLTIVAENVSLSEVLAAVREAMGADIDIPASAAAQRVWVSSGPGPARRVLRDLLDDTGMDYVIQASEVDSEGVRSVVLTPHGKGPDAGVVENAEQKKAGRTMPAAVLHAAQVPQAPATEVKAKAETDASASPILSSVDSRKVDSRSALSTPPAPPTSSAEASSPITGTPEQVIQRLQNLYEQRRQLEMQSGAVRGN